MPEILLNRFAVQQPIARGGMSEVFRGRDLQTDETVAIKRFNVDSHPPAITLESFRRELDALSNLRHENIVRIISHGKDSNDTPFLVIEWMDCDLLMRRDRKSSEFDGWDDFASTVLMPVVEALAYAHGDDRCHRDVKPANILVSSTGTVKLADFGISKLKRCLQPRVTLLNKFASAPFTPPEPDDGSYSFSRDVFSVGVLALWALSDVALVEYEEIPKALERVDVIPEIRAILKRAVTTNPAERFATAGLLELELRRVQNSRERNWFEKDRRCCLLEFNKRPISIVKDQLGIATDPEAVQYMEADIGADATIDRAKNDVGTSKERIVPNHYYLYGQRFAYRIAPNDRGKDLFSVIGVNILPEYLLARIKEDSVLSPVFFSRLSRPRQMITAKVANGLIEEALLAADQLRIARDQEQRVNLIFDQWTHLISARQAYERQQGVSIEFNHFELKGRQLKLFTEDDLSAVQIDEPRVIHCPDRNRIYGDVWQIDSDGVILYCHGGTPQSCPPTGRLQLDIRAAERSLERQRLAVERVRHRNAVANSLSDILIDPTTATASSDAPLLLKESEDSLDASQLDALKRALSTNDVLLIQGPPGTGKTRFIAALVKEFIAKNRGATVLLTSQTHIAIDNALQRIAKVLPGSPLLRVARLDATEVSADSSSFLLDAQMQSWRKEVAKRTELAMEKWAESLGVSKDDIKVGTTLQQIGLLRNKVVELRSRVQSLQEQLDGLQAKKFDMPTIERKIEIDSIEEELRLLRSKLNADKHEEDKLVGQLKQLTKDADDFLALDPQDLIDWSRDILEQTDATQTAQKLLRIQSEWLERFGRDESFTAALFERSNVVAATCIGLASVPGTDSIEYDLCIIDEASKVDATAALVPMVRAKKWILVGDSRQLPPFEDPVLKDASIRDRFMIESEEVAESMFERFKRLLPGDHQCKLNVQYRMAPAIGNLISNCFYAGELENGNRELSRVESLLRKHRKKAVTWLSTRAFDSRWEQEHGPGVYVNPCEAEEILNQLSDLSKIQFEQDDRMSVLVISGYQAQAKYLAREIGREQSSFKFLDIDCCTIDAVQGREADVVLFSVTRSNRQSKAGFLQSEQRINVALSRAQGLLIIVGDDSFVWGMPDPFPLKDVLTHIVSSSDECAIEEVRPRLKLGGAR